MKEKVDVLGELSDIIPDLTDNPTKEQLYQLYGVYLQELSRCHIEVDGYSVSINKAKVKNCRVFDKMLLNKEEAFCHIITREDGDNSGRRSIKANRANKIHWIKVILENKDDQRIKFFEERINGRFTKFYWFKDKSYIVILRELKSSNYLVTGYCVDPGETARFNAKWRQYRLMYK